jgi:hypothetical protein
MRLTLLLPRKQRHNRLPLRPFLPRAAPASFCNPHNSNSGLPPAAKAERGWRPPRRAWCYDAAIALHGHSPENCYLEVLRYRWRADSEKKWLPQQSFPWKSSSVLCP